MALLARDAAVRSLALLATFLSLVFAACSGTREAAPEAARFTLEEVLGRMPPRDSLEARWLGASVLDLGPDAIRRLCVELDPGGTPRSAPAEYALHAVGLLASRPNAEADRARYADALVRSLEPRPSVRAISFVLAQLEMVGRAESVPAVSRFLTDPLLCAAAARTLVAIGGEADAALLASLAASEGRCRLSIVQGLGALRSRRAVDALRGESASADSAIGRAAREALAQIETPTGRADSILAAALGTRVETREPGASGAHRGVPGGVGAAPENVDSIRSTARSGSGPEQIAAVRRLGAIGGQDARGDLLAVLLAAADDQLSAAAQKSLVQVSMRVSDPELRADPVLDAFRSGTRAQRRALLPVLGRLGGRRSLSVVSEGLKSPDAEMREASVRALSDWPTAAAYDTLLAVARGREKEALRILALRGCVRVVEQADLTPTEAVRYHERTLASAWRAEEKRLVLGTLANIPTPYALRVAAPYVADEHVGRDAALAAGRIAGAGAPAPGAFGAPEAARAFIEAYVPSEEREEVKRVLDLPTTTNEAPEGFRALFNGRDLAGWKGLVGDPISRSRMTPAELSAAQAKADSNMRAHWSVDAGVLLFDGKGESLCTEEDFGDFELIVDWKIEPFGDSGIYLRGSPQVQIWDPVQWPEGSGGLYNNQKHPARPLRCADRAVGEWNTFRIRMVGDRVTVVLNGVVVVDSVVMENYWDRTLPIFSSGQIELQAHHTPLAFRNIYIREIPRRSPLSSGRLFNGADLDGWTVVDGVPEAWGAENGVLFTRGGDGGWLATNREYDNFELELDVRVGEGGNSGIFLRAPRQGDPAYTGLEVQVLDDTSPRYAALKPWQYCGSIYGVVAAAKGAVNEPNEWQHFRIVACGPRVTVTLNGIQVVDADLVAHMDREAAHPGLKRRSGYIGLQCHGDRVEFRNITLKELAWSESHDGH